MQTDLHALMHQLKAARTPFAVATVIATEGSVSAKLGSKALILDTGERVAGWVGGGCAESQCQQSAVEAINSEQPVTVEIDLDDEMLGAGMPCGGRMTVFIDPVLPSPSLWILGHGRIAEALCQLAKVLGLHVIVNDPLATPTSFPAADERQTDDLDYSALQPKPEDFVVIATQHKGDHESLQRVLQTQVGYIGLIASRKRARLVLEHFQQQGLTDAQLARIQTPCGIEIGAATPEEIALSILAEITHRRRSKIALLQPLTSKALPL